MTRDADVRMTTTQQRVASFTLAVNREWKDKTTGEKKSEADFINCQAWGATADIVQKYTSKGKQILVDGRLSVRKYKGKDGTDKWATEVVVDNLMLLGGDRSGAGNAAQPASSGYQGMTLGGDEPDFPLDFSQLGGEEIDLPF